MLHDSEQAQKPQATGMGGLRSFLMKGVYAIVIFVCGSFITGCITNDCLDKYSFILTGDLLRKANEKGYDYCEVLDSALKGDSISILQLSSWTFYDGLSAEHGAVLIEVVARVGEERFIGMIKNQSIRSQYDVVLKLEPGFDFTENKTYAGSSLERAFPLLAEHKLSTKRLLKAGRAI